MRGRDGAERYPQAVDVDLDVGGASQPAHARSVAHARLGAGRRSGIREDEEIIRARNATLRERPADVKKFFLAQLRPIVPAQPASRAHRAGGSLGAGATIRTDSDPPMRGAWIRELMGPCSSSPTPCAGAQAVTLQIKPHVGDTLRMRLDQQSEMTGVKRTSTRRSDGDGHRTMNMFSRAIVEGAARRRARRCSPSPTPKKKHRKLLKKTRVQRRRLGK